MNDQNEVEVKIIFLKGKRLNLRLIQKSDAERLLAWMNDPEVTHFLHRCFPLALEEEMKWIDGLYKSSKDLVFGIETKEGKLIGTMGLHKINYIDGTATTGACIGDKEYWGGGYGSEAKMLLLNHAFNTLNLRKINSEVVGFNERSVNYSLKCGYKIEGRKKAEVYKHGKYWDLILLAVFRDDWFSLWDEYQKTGKLPSHADAEPQT